jgi:GMP synthase-like glutamine amidotransferase
VPPGYLAEWASARGHSAEVVAVPALERWPRPGAQDLVVSLGSDCSVHASPEPWIADEIEFVRSSRAAGARLLGICFGGQLLAAAFGGRALRAPVPHADWRGIPTSAPELIAPGPWFRWHEDMFEVPPAARLLAGTPDEPMAFALESIVGLQFHPEVGRELAEQWVDGGREKLSSQSIDELRLRGDIELAAPGARARAFNLFDRLVGWLSGESAYYPQVISTA